MRTLVRIVGGFVSSGSCCVKSVNSGAFCHAGSSRLPSMTGASLERTACNCGCAGQFAVYAGAAKMPQKEIVMTALTALWLPILLSSVFVFIVSSIIHMTPLWHKNDYPLLPNQDQVMAALRPLAIPPGDYVLPRAKDMKEMRTPEFKE